MSRQLAAQRRLLLDESSADERVPGGRHDGPPAPRRHRFGQTIRAFHVEDDGLARPAGEDGPGVEDQEFVPPDDPPGGIDRSDPVAVSVEGDAGLGASFLDAGDEDLEVGRYGGVRVMVGIGAVGFAEELVHLGADGSEGSRRDGPAGAVSRVEDHLDGPGKRQIPRDALDIGGLDLHLLEDARGCRRVQAAPVDDSANFLNLIAVNGLVAAGNLEAVEFGGIVAPGDLDASGNIEVVRRERKAGSGSHPDSDDMTAGRAKALAERFVVAGRGEAIVPAQGNPGAPGSAQMGAEALP